MRKIPLLIAMLLVFSTASCGQAKPTAIQASGQIEAKQVSVAPELPGRVVEVYVDEGESVKVGDPLLRLDDSLLVSAKQAAQAALDSASINIQAVQSAMDVAQAQYNLTLSAALEAQRSDRQDLWKQSRPSEFNQPVWYFSRVELTQSAQAEIDAAQTVKDQALGRLADAEKKSGNSTFLEIETNLLNARTAFEVAQTVLDQSKEETDGTDLSEAAQTAFDNAKAVLENAQLAYDGALVDDQAKDILNARAAVEVSSERYYVALDAMRALQTGEYSLSVVVAAKALDQARVMLEQAKLAVPAAQANLDLIETQMAQLTVQAAMDGVVQVRSVEVGEVLQAGMPVLTIARLDTLKVTVYIPENQYAQISLGQNATLSVDSFPEQTFPAVVTRIADQAEFTPRNVQTKEGRQTTVYAIELSVENQDGKLKPGLPVDVTF
jgi:HlyD family secretion protein